MRQILKRMIPLGILIAVVATSCSDAKSNPEEEKEINSMDSVSQVVKDSTEKLEDQTRKVEESLEKLNKEFENETTTDKK